MRDPTSHLHLNSIKSIDKHALERFSRDYDQGPICTQLTGNPGTIASGSPGALSVVTWTPNSSPIYDPYTMVTPATTDIRIPWDGFYNFWMVWSIADNVATAESFSCGMYVANTSSTGFASPSYSLQPGTQGKLLTQGTATVDRSFMCDYRGVELHANDLVRFQARVYGTQALTATTVTAAEFTYIHQIPHQ